MPSLITFPLFQRTEQVPPEMERVRALPGLLPARLQALA